MNAVDDGPMDRIWACGRVCEWKKWDEKERIMFRGARSNSLLSEFVLIRQGKCCQGFCAGGILGFGEIYIGLPKEAFLMMEREGLMLKVGWEDGLYAKEERFWKLSLSSMAVGHFILRHSFEFKWAVNKNNKCIGEVKHGEFDLFSL
ncbi:uncharacterized protein RAG0_06227 [Rhynchosporium agropyri]|uniref:Uncharacterized protein n=1 Tax=Rhynchosporium agropyri TaxID=914238 RepID=A0A1E1KGD3_9HELO|nr:uncharacterized protein RAG0_06227 [Rhynchosporium agropyri]